MDHFDPLEGPGELWELWGSLGVPKGALKRLWRIPGEGPGRSLEDAS